MNVDNLRKLVGRRVLVKTWSNYRHNSAQELRVLEVSPSGNWCKFLNNNGRKEWRPTENVEVIEVLLGGKTT